MKRQDTFRSWLERHKGQSWIGVRQGMWRIYPGWPKPGHIFKWSGWLPDLWYWIKCRFWKRYNRVEIRTLSPEWCDADARLLHAAFEILRGVIEDEEIFEMNSPEGDLDDPDSWAFALQEMRDLWHWWTVERPAREAEYERRLDRWYRLRFEQDASEEVVDLASKMLRKMDDEIRSAEDDEMLHRLINIRTALWT